MNRRRVAGVVSLVGLACAIAAACASGSTGVKTAVTPCMAKSQPTWSPDGTEFAFYATRWPRPAGDSNPADILHAVCTANADGTNVQPVKYTVCTGKKCPEPPTLIAWTQRGILYASGGSIFRLVPGNKPQKVAKANAVAYVTNLAGTRIATQKFFPGCMACGAPVTILDAGSGAVVGTAGGKKFVNFAPSLSPDGTKVAFEREAGDASGKSYGIWTATAKGAQLKQLVKVGQQPLWAPTGNKIAYVVPAGSSGGLHLISAAGGKSRTLVSRGAGNVFGWSPDGRYIAFVTSTGTSGKLAIVDAATGKVRSLLALRYAPAVAWAPDSSELLATSTSTVHGCPSLYRVPVDGSKPTKITSCS